MLDLDRLAQVARRLDPAARLMRAWPLTGGVSADVTGLRITHADGGTHTVIVRQHGEADRRRNPRIAADEFRLLGTLRENGLPVPEPLLLDESGDIFPTPYLVLAYVAGRPAFAPADLPDALERFATTLSQIHRLDLDVLAGLPLPDFDTTTATRIGMRPARLDESIGEGRIRAALEAIWPPPSNNVRCLLHGDFWPGNVIWREGQLAAILDWEDAAIGDPLADLGNSRLEMLWLFEQDAMRDFTRRYQAQMPHLDDTALPAWDLVAALRPAFKLVEWKEDPEEVRRMREDHTRFVDQALAALPRP
jgi:aminoglycoside phosphotransferase (APT) family kinase protein